MSPELHLDRVRVAYGPFVVLTDVSFAAAPGEIVAVIGPNGAGKTSLFNVIAGSLRPAGGAVTFGGRRISGRGPFRAARCGVARTWQVARPFADLSVLDNVIAALGGRAYYQPWTALRPAGNRKTQGAAHQLLASVGVPQPYNRPASELPIGHLRLLEVARALATRPQAILLDEPAAGLRGTEIDTLEHVLTDLRSQGHVVLLVEHNVPLALRAADRVVVLADQGKLAEGPPAEIRKDERVVAAYLGHGHADG